MWVLTAIGALLLILTGVGLWRQHVYDTDGFTVLMLVQGACYLAAVALTWRAGLSRRALVAVLAVAALMRLVVLLAPPYLSDDINRYVWDGRVEAAGLNPYRYVPADPQLASLRDETIFPNINRSDYAPTIYPPVAEYIFFLGTRLGESLTAMKATLLVFELAGVLLLLRLLQDSGLPRARILIYAWHPLTLWEFAGSGHVDAAIVTFVALAAAALLLLAVHSLFTTEGRYLASAMTLAVAAMVLLSPHYPWYFAWLVPFICFIPRPSVLYLTVACPLLYFVPGGPDPAGARLPFEWAIYGPFAALVAFELWRRRVARTDIGCIKGVG